MTPMGCRLAAANQSFFAICPPSTGSATPLM
jgi:hypothetical protein